MHKPLGGEASQQALHHALFEVQVHHVVIQRARVGKDDRAQRRGAPPFPHGLVTPPGRAQGVQGLDPGGIRPVPLVEGREDEPLAAQGGPVAGGRCEGCGADKLQGTGNRRAERGLLDAGLFLRDVEEGAEPVDLCPQGGLPLAGRFQFVVDGATVFGGKVGREDLTLQPRKRLPADAAPERLRQVRHQ